MKFLIILTFFLLLNLSTSNRIYKRIELKQLNHIVIPEQIIKHVKKYESYSGIKYYLNKDVYIGYGHKIKKNEQFDSITESQATELLIKDFLINYEIINKKLNNLHINLNQNQKLALTLLAYNCGPYKVFKWNLFDSIINNKDCTIWLEYCYFNNKRHKNLFKRRLFEYNLFKN